MTQDELNQKLFKAITNNNLEQVQSLLKIGASISAKNKNGLTPLLYATTLERTQIIKCLLESGANVNEQKEGGFSPLHLAIFWGNVELVELLLNFGADVNAQNNIGDSPLHAAIRYGKPEIVKLLLKKCPNININIQGEHGWTPLHLAASLSSKEIVAILMQYKADPFILSVDADTPHDVARVDNQEIRKMLNEYMEIYNSIIEEESEQPSIFDNALLDSVYYNNLEGVKKYLYMGFDINYTG